MSRPLQFVSALLILSSLLTLIPAPAVRATGLYWGCDGFSTEYFSSPECDALMMAEPSPPVVNLAVDYGAADGYTFMRVVSDHVVTVYSAPGGGYALYTIDAGFNFITPRTVTDTWTEINANEWIETRYLQWVEPSTFTGVFIQSEPARPFGWILKDLYASATPGGEQVISRDMLLFRYQLMNIYATVNVNGLDWYLVAPGKWVEQRLMGVARRVARPASVSGRWVAVDLYEQVLVAYENDTMVFATLVSSGLPDWSTQEGQFQVWGRRQNGPMSGAEGEPDFYRLENVPYALYFDGDISLHGTYWHNGFGYRHSHGCVNLSISDAHWLYDWLVVGNSVYVYYSRPY
ncbi:MAG TPA: L,D-transpeptidase family protein [Aggregatilineaceae bacterium]|nr:L,D-transpeptidase family protein [Aggregatilineaceae bacterium]